MILKYNVYWKSGKDFFCKSIGRILIFLRIENIKVIKGKECFQFVIVVSVVNIVEVLGRILFFVLKCMLRRVVSRLMVLYFF